MSIMSLVVLQGGPFTFFYAFEIKGSFSGQTPLYSIREICYFTLYKFKYKP